MVDFGMNLAKNDKGAAVFDTVGLEKEKYRLGHTQVFFRAGVLGQTEEIREEREQDRSGPLLAPTFCRAKMSRIGFKNMQSQKIALYSH